MLMAMQTGGGGLPSEYQQVDWIGCSGFQYINLGIVPSASDVIETEFAMNNISAPSSPQNFTLYSAGDGTYQFTTVFQKGTSAAYAFGRYFSNSAAQLTVYYTSFPTSTDWVWMKHRVNGGTEAQSLWILANSYNKWISAPFLTDTLSGNNTDLLLFKRVGSTSNYFVGRMRTFFIERNGRKILNLVPCFRKADFVAGFFDLVSRTFFTNAGTGVFEVPAQEEYPVGTDIIGTFLGRSANWIAKGTIQSDGTFAIGTQDTYASELYVPVNPSYTYQKNDYRLRRFAYYDADHVFISSVVYNNLNVQEIPALPANARWARIETGNATNRNGIKVTRIA